MEAVIGSDLYGNRAEDLAVLIGRRELEVAAGIKVRAALIVRSAVVGVHFACVPVVAEEEVVGAKLCNEYLLTVFVLDAGLDFAEELGLAVVADPAVKRAALGLIGEQLFAHIALGAVLDHRPRYRGRVNVCADRNSRFVFTSFRERYYIFTFAGHIFKACTCRICRGRDRNYRYEHQHNKQHGNEFSEIVVCFRLMHVFHLVAFLGVFYSLTMAIIHFYSRLCNSFE